MPLFLRAQSPCGLRSSTRRRWKVSNTSIKREAVSVFNVAPAAKPKPDRTSPALQACNVQSIDDLVRRQPEALHHFQCNRF